MTSWNQHKGDARNGGVRRDLEGPLRVKQSWTVDLTGSVGTPVLDRDTVYVGTGRGNCYALERETGRRRWVFETMNATSTTPVVTRTRVYVGTEEGTIYALDPATGDQQWATELPGSLSSSLTVADGRLYAGHTAGVSAIALEDGTGSPLETESADDGAVDDGDVVWTYETDAPAVGCPAVDDGENGGGDGERRFGERETEPDPHSNVDGNLETSFDTDFDHDTTHDDGQPVVFVGTEDETVLALAGATGEEEWTAPADGAVAGGPTVADGLVYVPDQGGTLLAMGVDSGQSWFSYDIRDGFVGSATVLPDDDTTFVGAEDGYLHVTDTSFGRRKLRGWLFAKKGVQLDGPLRGSPVVVGDVVCVGDATGSLYGLDVADDCTHLWHYGTDAAITGTPAVGDRQLFVGNEDGVFHCLTWRSDGRRP
ncbi:outer membrane protein assembly factor BamB family protein [Halobiforma nitratireducens]|uniref:Pyrrolo-quinoline quinone repeat-containing protein n=1 Tax=Halobiforma nitratireducens JCM 10879 TaxID=1227454 RepID=M0MLB1_9EURY|nr:PQQ-binding-like beta-propeller repeat protein [Halobiforma nitratireducens]EMA46482.1 Pyrrolo-quinoline quinone repeat-containing protein [Halobiforma nitratireducens JCM 10879]